MRKGIVSLLAIGLLLVTCVVGRPSVAAPRPLVIGLSIALTGEISDAAAFIKLGYELWAQDQDAKGGLLGRPVQLREYDDQSDPQTSARLYEKLITQDKVDLIIGPYSSAVTSAASTVAEKYRMVMLASGASAPGIWKRGYKYVFQIPPSARNYYVGAIDIARKEGYKTVALLGEDSDYPRDAVPGAADYARDHRMQVGYQQFYPPKTTEFSSYLAHIRSDNPDVLINAGYLPEDLALIREMRGLGINLRMLVLGVGASLPDWAKTAGKDGDYVFAASQWEPSVKTPGNGQFVVEFARQFSRVPDYRAAQAYAAGQILAMAAEKAGSLNQDRLRDVIAGLDITTVFNHFKVDQTGAQVGAKLFLTQWQHDQKQVVWPFDVATAKYLLPTPSWDKR